MGMRDLIDQLNQIADYTVPFALRAVAELGVADLLTTGPRTADELADATGTHRQSLFRTLRALSCVGVFTETEGGGFALTPMGQLLRSDHPLSLREAYPVIASDIVAWTRFRTTLETGQAAFPLVHGRTYYEHLAAHEAEASRLNGSAGAQSRLVLRSLIGAYDWKRCGTIVDVGGGTGEFLVGLLARYKDLRGVLYDRPHVVAKTGALLESADVRDRCLVRSGDFFDQVPAGGDTYVLKTILHDWDDESATTILRTIHAAMGLDAKLLVLEPLLPAGDAFHVGKLLDLHSLVTIGGVDRGEAEIAGLLSTAGLRLVGVRPSSTLAVYEAARDR